MNIISQDVNLKIHAKHTSFRRFMMIAIPSLPLILFIVGGISIFIEPLITVIIAICFIFSILTANMYLNKIIKSFEFGPTLKVNLLFKTIESPYEEIIDIGNDSFDTKNWSLYFGSLLNAKDISLTFQKLINYGKIDPYKLKGELLLGESSMSKVSYWPVFFATLFSLLIGYFGVSSIPGVSLIAAGLIEIILFLVIYLVIKWRIKAKIKKV